VALANRRLLPAIKAAGPEVEVVASGISCRQQIEHLAGRTPKHPAELLWEALAQAPPHLYPLRPRGRGLG